MSAGNLSTLLLNDEELWNVLRSVAHEKRGDECCFDAGRHIFYDQRILSAFQCFIDRHLDYPSHITAKELAELAYQQLSGVPFDIDFEGSVSQYAVRRFCALASADCLDDAEDGAELQGERSFDLGKWCAGTTEGDTIEIAGYAECGSFFLDLFVSPTPSTGSGASLDYDYSVVSRANGFCSPGALVHAESWFSELVPSIAKSVHCAAAVNELCATKAKEVLDALTFEEDASETRNNVEEYPTESGLYTPPISLLLAEDAYGRTMFEDCLRAVAESHKSNCDVFTRRLSNAVTLLSVADNSDSIAVSFALCFSAIESLVCEHPDRVLHFRSNSAEGRQRTETTVQIKKYVPALLMPRDVGRGKRGAILYDLYQLRCNILHGTCLNVPEHALSDLRRIAAGVIRAVVQWRRDRMKRGDSTAWDEFFERNDQVAFGKLPRDDVPDLSSLFPHERRVQKYRQ